MRAKHVTSDRQYRDPFGAVQVGGAVLIRIDVWDDPNVQVKLRLWVDGRGEELLDMAFVGQGEDAGPDTPMRFEASFSPSKPEIVWYSFQIIASDGSVWRYGAAADHSCGEGEFAFGEPPSFQLTVYERTREVLPEWYKNGIVYQVFPDRFARDDNWEDRARTALEKPRKGPARRLVDDWATYPHYERTAEGRIAAWDFYGGSLDGVRQKLPYLESLGVTAVYLNPIFEAASNHRYDTADYLRIDPMLGDEKAFSRLCDEAARHGISIILDGVFNHVGSDSLYFDKYGNYGGIGAMGNEHSPYRSWFHFRDDGSYASWWGVDDLPETNEDSPGFQDLICARDGVVRKWLRLGARGWRLDVADELTDEFIVDIKASALAEKSDAVVIGEVWEDASNKRAYGKLREYFLGRELDGTMNYPLRHALEFFLTNRSTAADLAEELESLYENYPPEAFYSELNLLGSHDRMRLFTVLGGAPLPGDMTDEQCYHYRLDDSHRGLAISRLWVAALIQMTMPGVPCVYYGDEAGLEGYADPYCRASFPWGHENRDCLATYRNAIAVRKSLPVFVDGDFEPFSINDDVFGFWRRKGDVKVCVLANASLANQYNVRVPQVATRVDDIVSGRPPRVADGEVEVFLWPLGTSVLYFHEPERLQAPMQRGMGVLAHITSIPNLDNPGKPGTLGEPARKFIDYLYRGGQTYWQMLPVNPTDEYGSPYAGLSAFAGNTDLMWGLEQGNATLSTKFEGTPELRRFVEDNEDWLIPYAVFRSIKSKLGEKPWQEWPEEYRTYDSALARDPELSHAVNREVELQYMFMQQWNEMRGYARERGVKIIGDMPMYVSADSADVWAHPELFYLDQNGYPAEVAGCPPDSFAQEGQLWGNPTYNWRHMKETGYQWWMRRLERAFSLYDYVRLDHFLGFSSYYRIPGGASAKEGAWFFGPGLDLFQRAYKKFGPLPVIAEDLGTITPAVRALVSTTGFPGMDVVQFFDGDVREGYEPKPDKLVYTSTHDTQTLLGWARERFGLFSDDGETALLARDLATKIARSCLASEADVVMLALQDVLMLGDEARMNVPGVAEGNWSWRADYDDVAASTNMLDELARESGRWRSAGD